MVKRKYSKKEEITQQQKRLPRRITRITADTPYGECSERLTPFGGLVALLKFLDLLGYERLFERHYIAPGRKSVMGDYRMILGILLLLFIGFQRLGHFVYVRVEAMMCGIMQVEILPAVSTFWRYLRGMGIVQSKALLRLNAALRAVVWEKCDYRPRSITVNVDTTVSTVYGEIEGARKGHNPKHRGKKGLRPVLCFLEQTREYLCGRQRRGETISAREVGREIRKFRALLPECVEEVKVRGDGEFLGWESVKACLEEGFTFIFGNKRCTPPFHEEGWYKHGEHEYNECVYQPQGWELPCRFVAMRISRERLGDRQLRLLKEDNYVYRMFATNDRKRPHLVIEDYDSRAEVEKLIAEAQGEGLLAIPSKRFQTNHAFFQLVMLAYNLWRWMKLLAGHAQSCERDAESAPAMVAVVLPKHTLQVARLRMLFVAAKICFHGNKDEVRYSVHEQRAAGLMDFLEYLDKRRREGG